MMRKWRWMIGLLIVALVGWIALSLWDAMTPVPLQEAVWQAPHDINWVLTCDLDGDGYEELLVTYQNVGVSKDWWWMRLKDGEWQAERIPLATGQSVMVLRNALLITDLRQRLWLLRYRKGWQWQKVTLPKDVASELVDPHLIWRDITDLDGDGREDDLALETQKQVWWLELEEDGQLRLREKALLPKRMMPWMEFGFWVQQGKLRVESGQWKICYADLDGDGQKDFFGWRLYPAKIVVVLSKTGEEYHLNLPSQPPKVEWEWAGWGEPFDIGDFDGDGKDEVLIWGRKGGQWDLTEFLARFWYADGRLRHEVTTLPGFGRPFSKWLLTVDKRQWLLMDNEAIWLTEKGWQRKRWDFKGDIAHCWQDAKGVAVGVHHSLWVSDYPIWNTLRKFLARLRSYGLPVPVPPASVEWMEVWRLDEKRFQWRLEGAFRIGAEGSLDLQCADLNGDGQPELLAWEDHTGIWATLAVYTGWWRKRWRSVVLWDERGDGDWWWFVIFFPDGKRTWVVSINSHTRTIHAWTLRE